MKFEYTYYSTNDPTAFFMIFIIYITLYILGASMLYRFAKKNGYGQYAGWAWLPMIGAIYLRRKMSGDSTKVLWWFVGLLIPLVNFIVYFVIVFIYFSSIWRSYKYNSNGSNGVYMFLNLICFGWLGDYLAGNHIDVDDMTKKELQSVINVKKKRMSTLRMSSYEELQKRKKK